MIAPEILPIASESAVARAAAVLRAGGLVIIPTDTVYGLAAALDRPNALRRIYEVKDRSTLKPLPVLLSDPGMLPLAAAEPTPAIVRFAARFWPGPLTLVIPARVDLPTAVVGPDGTTGVRVPDRDDTRRLIALAGGALAVTSANRSGQPPAESAIDSLDRLGARVDMILDGGQSPGGLASTVARIAGGRIELLREGPIRLAPLENAWNEARVERAEDGDAGHFGVRLP